MLKTVGKAKVRDDDVAVPIQKEIFKLEIAVNNLFRVNVRYAGYELCKELASVLFFKVSVGKDMVEQLPTRSILENNAYVLVRFDNIVEPDNIWMFDGLWHE